MKDDNQDPTDTVGVGDADPADLQPAPSGSEEAPIQSPNQAASHRTWRLATWPLRALDFDDADMEIQFREWYWSESFRYCMAAVFTGSAWGWARIGLGMVGRSIGWERYSKCCASIFSFWQGAEESHLNFLFYEAVYPTLFVFLFLGPRFDANLAALCLRHLVPGYIKRRRSRRLSPFIMWNSDGGVTVSAIGEIWGYFASVGVAPIAAAPFLGMASPKELFRGEGQQAAFVLVSFCIMLRLRFPHALCLVIFSLGLSWITFAASSSLRVDGGEHLAVNSIFLLALTALGMLVILMVYRHERGSRASFTQLHKAERCESILLSVLASILPRHEVQRIATLAQANQPLVSSAEKYPNSAVIFIGVNMNESQSKSALDRMSGLNKIFRRMDDVVANHPHVYKVETVGAEYLCVAGVPNACESPTCAAISFALDVVQEVQELFWASGVKVEFKVGIHNGPLTAGIMGTITPQFRLFGDTVNTASRMKSNAAFGEIIVSDSVVASTRECCGVEIGGDGHVWFGKPAAVLTTVGERDVKGLGLMRLWRINSSPRGCPHDIPVCRANQFVRDEQPISTFVWSSASSWQNSGKPSNFMRGAISKWANWMSYMELEDENNSETLALEEALHAFSRISTMQIQSHAPFHFRASQIEKVFIAWRHAISDVSSLKVFFALMYLLYAMVAVVTVHSLATFQIESIVHETEYMHFMLVCVFFLCTTPFALAVAAYVSIYAPASKRKKYIWVTNWIYVFAMFGLLMCCVNGPSYAFASWITVDELIAHEAPARNWFEVVILQLCEKTFTRNGVLPINFALVAPNFGVFGVNFMLVTLQLVFETQPGYTYAFVTCFIVMSVLNQSLFGIRFSVVDFILSALVCLQVSYIAVLKRREFRSTIVATRTRLFVSNIIRRLLPDHVFKAYLSNELHSICDESVCGHLFLDLKGFTEMSKMLTPEESFAFLSSLFGAFDEICAKWEVVKIETIGDAYWCAAGIPGNANSYDMIRLLGLSIELQQILRRRSLPCFSILDAKIKGFRLEARVAIHHGTCFGGVVGSRRVRYHLFGTAVDVAQVLEQEGSVEGIVVSSAAARAIGLCKIGIVDNQKLIGVWNKVDDRIFEGHALTLTDYRLSSKGQSAIEQLESAECGIRSFESTLGREGQTASQTLPVVLVRMTQTDDGLRDVFDERDSAGPDAPKQNGLV